MKALKTSYEQKNIIYSALKTTGVIKVTTAVKNIISSALRKIGVIKSSITVTNIINTELHEVPRFSDFLLLETGHYVLTEHERPTGRGLSDLRPIETQYNTRDDVP